jgi:hydrogenase nickel incorporation protein HypB
MNPRLLEIRQGVLSKNDERAAKLRERFLKVGILALNLVSSPGAGKTLFLKQTMEKLIAQDYKVGALVGDLQTDNDARFLAKSGAPVRQIETAGNCHLEAALIDNYLADWDLTGFDFFFIENVGNLVCPANYDLGESLRVVLLSTTEGEDKPLKYPPMFHSADVCIISKIDLAEAVEFDHEAAYENIHAVHPEMTIFEVSAKTSTGMQDWLDFLQTQKQKIVGAKRASPNGVQTN